MTNIDLNQYVPVEPDFFSSTAMVLAQRVVGCLIIFIDLRNDQIERGGIAAEAEAYEAGDLAAHCDPGSAPQRRLHSGSMLLPHGHAYIHMDRGMPCLNLVCDREGHGSAVLIRALVPLFGVDSMAKLRSAHPSADRTIRERAPGFEKRLCNGPAKVGEALGLYPLLDGASLYKRPFRILRPIEPVTELLNGPRINVSKDAHRQWRWGHPGYREWLSAPFSSTTASA